MLFATIFLTICLPILVLIGAGWWLDRWFDFDLRTLVKLNIYLFVPVFIFVRLSTSTIPGKTGVQVMLFTVCVIVCMSAISWLVAKLYRYSPADRAGLQLGTMIYNSGNWGLPLLTLAFPGEGGVIQVFVLATMNLTTFTAGVFLAHSAHKDPQRNPQPWFLHLLPILKQPSIYAIALAILLRVFGNPLVDIEPIWKPLNYIASGLVGFALITLGVQLSKTRPPKPIGRLGWALGIRLLGGPAVAIVLVWLFNIEGTLAPILIVGAASPTAVNTALLAYEFGADSRFAAAVVYYSTLVAALVVALLLTLLKLGWIPGVNF